VKKGVLIFLKDWKRTSHWKNWILTVFHHTSHFSVEHFSDCEITSEGMKSISSFLSQDGIVLEELNLRVFVKTGFFKIALWLLYTCFHRNHTPWLETNWRSNCWWHFYKFGNPCFVIFYWWIENMENWTCSTFHFSMWIVVLHTRNQQQWRLFVSLSWCGFIFDSFFMFIFFILQLRTTGVCLYDIAELLVPCLAPEVEEYDDYPN